MNPLIKLTSFGLIAMSAAQAAQAGVDATNEKIARMFKKSVSK